LFVRKASREDGMPLPPDVGRALADYLVDVRPQTSLRCGANLIDIGQVLRHRNLATTALYAKVDLVTLRSIAQPWPGDKRSARWPTPRRNICGCVIDGATSWPTAATAPSSLLSDTSAVCFAIGHRSQ
jgi:hypothetical protein